MMAAETLPHTLLIADCQDLDELGRGTMGNWYDEGGKIPAEVSYDAVIRLTQQARAARGTATTRPEGAPK